MLHSIKPFPPLRVYSKPNLDFITSNTLYNLIYYMQYRLPVKLFGLYADTLGNEQTKKQARVAEKFERKVRFLSEAFTYFVNNQWIFDTTNTMNVFG